MAELRTDVCRWSAPRSRGVSLAVKSAKRITSKNASPSIPNQQEWISATELRTPTLEINSIVQHGHIVEVNGVAESGSLVMINGQRVPLLYANSGFTYFVGPLADGVTILTVTVQNENGGVNTKKLAVTLP